MQMLNKDKETLKHLINNNGKEAILVKLNESEDKQGIINSEYYVTFPVDCTSKDIIDVKNLQSKLNNNIGNLPFIIDTTYGNDNVFVTIGFNNDIEAEEINEFVCNLMFGGSMDDYMREAEMFYLGHVEALGVPIFMNDPAFLDEGAFDSYKNKRSVEDKKINLQKTTDNILNENVKDEITKYLTDRFINEGEDLINKIEADSEKYDQCYIIPFVIANKFFSSTGKTPAIIGKSPIEVFPRISSNDCAVVIYFSYLGRLDYISSHCHYFNDVIFDYINELEKDLSSTFEMNIIIKLRFFDLYNGKEARMLEKNTVTHLHKKVTVSKFINFINRFLEINVSGVRNSYYAPIIDIDKPIINNPSTTNINCSWSKSFLLRSSDIQCKTPKASFALLQTLL